MCGSLNTSLSLAFLAKHISLASLFPSKSDLEKPNLPEDVSLNKLHVENLAFAAWTSNFILNFYNALDVFSPKMELIW